MKKVIGILLALVICLSMAVTALATDDGFVSSPGEDGTPCKHEHTIVKDKKDATCTKDGHTGVTECEDCGEILDEGEVIPAHGHKFDSNGVCTICGVRDVPKTGDDSNMILWVSLMVLSAAAVITVTSIRRKQA